MGYDVDIDTLEIKLIRGNYAILLITAEENDVKYTFKPEDVIRLKVFKKKDCEDVVFSKDIKVETKTDSVEFELLSSETKIGDIISKPTTYWYEIELNPDTEYTQTLIGYTKEDGAKLFTLLPEGGNLEND